MIPFLSSVAQAYYSRYTDLTDFCFLFPNKRSATFFIKHLRSLMPANGIMLAPRTMTISDLVTTISGVDCDSRIDLLCRLYNSYLAVLNRHGADNKMSFDSFMTWGETVLNDFSEVDLYCVEPDEIFKNVKDYREIETDFLTSAQKRILAAYFGRTTDIKMSDNFWNTFEDIDNAGLANGDEKPTRLRKRFIELWRLLAPVYHEFSESLAADGLATPGGIYRVADERLKEVKTGELPFKKMVAVGFNALTGREINIFRQLSERTYEGKYGDEPYLDFVWDLTGPILTNKTCSAARYVNINRQEFPEPEWLQPYLQLCHTDVMPPQIELIASPGNSQQTKIAGEIVAQLAEKYGAKTVRDANVAVVLADENLLFPMLGAVAPMTVTDAKNPDKEPEKVGLNLTMGYEMRLSQVVAFAKLLRTLQFTRRENYRYGDSAGVAYSKPRIAEVISHPYARILLGDDIVNQLNKYLRTTRITHIPLNKLYDIVPSEFTIFNPVKREGGAEDAARYLDKVMYGVQKNIMDGKNGSVAVKGKLEVENIASYRDALRRLQESLKEHRIVAGAATFFNMAERLINSERVSFEGEPLQGLQVMGMLETRALDFRHVIITSVNENILPRRSRQHTFIPEALRHAYGLPPGGYEESIFAYYFYRLLSRAESVTLIYDSRVGAEGGARGSSRYIEQLLYQYVPRYMQNHGFTRRHYNYAINGRRVQHDNIEKTPEIKELLQRFLQPESKSTLSATALTEYCNCEVKFFYRYVLGLRDDVSLSENIDPMTQGVILHAVMEDIYLEDEKMHGKLLESPRLVTTEMIRRHLEDDNMSYQLITKHINKEFYKYPQNEWHRSLEGSMALVAEMLLIDLKKLLKKDLEYAPFKLYGTEIRDDVKLQIGDKNVNFQFAIDRLDCVVIDGKEVMRIVDYKTGKTHLRADDIDAMMSGDYRSTNILQLMTYAYIANRHLKGFPGDRDQATGNVAVRLEIYSTQTDKTESLLPRFLKEEAKVKDKVYDGDYAEMKVYTERSAEFEEKLKNKIAEIFDKPCFDISSDSTGCQYCAMRNICGR